MASEKVGDNQTVKGLGKKEADRARVTALTMPEDT